MDVKKVCAGLCVLLVLWGCETVEINKPSLEGRYIGYFNRSGGDTADVALEFIDQKFEGESAEARYPAIGKGVFRQTENSIEFIDSSRWAADFDPSLVLAGQFNFKKNHDGTIRIWKETGKAIDELILRRTH